MTGEDKKDKEMDGKEIYQSKQLSGDELEMADGKDLAWTKRTGQTSIKDNQIYQE